MTPEVYVQFFDLPGKVHEVIHPNADGSYTVFIDCTLSHDAQIKAYYHALTHIQNCDFEKSDVQSIEAAAHQERTATQPVDVSSSVESPATASRDMAAAQQKESGQEEAAAQDAPAASVQTLPPKYQNRIKKLRRERRKLRQEMEELAELMEMLQVIYPERFDPAFMPIDYVPERD